MCALSAGSPAEDPDRNGDSLCHGAVVHSATIRRGGTRASTKMLKRIWIPLVVVGVVAIAGFSVGRLQEIGNTEITWRGSDLGSDSKLVNPKIETYEIFGIEGATAVVNYPDLAAMASALPRSITVTTTTPPTGPNTMGQRDDGAMGCRVTVNGAKDENSSRSGNALTFCWVKSA